MTPTNGPQMDLAAFQALLDAYGSDRTRWPGLKRGAADALLATSAAARQRHSEAAALDQILHAADDLDDSAVDPALVDRIVTKAVSTPRLTSSNQLNRTSPTPAAPLPSLRPRQPFPRAATRHDVWRNATLVAASLLVGLFIGQSQYSIYAVPALETLTGQVISGQLANANIAEIGGDIGEDE